MKIIPSIDVLGGKCVRLDKGSFDNPEIYHDSPLDLAKSFEDSGIENLHLVDLDGAKGIEIVNWKLLEKICEQTNLEVNYGGGLKTKGDIVLAMECGASQVNIGSVAVHEPDEFYSWIQDFGSDEIMLAADIRDGQLVSDGWLKNTDRDLFTALGEYVNNGLEYLIAADVSMHGSDTGPALDLYKKILEHFPNLKLIAKGGVSSKEELEVLEQMKVEGCILGRALFDGRINLEEVLTK